MSESETSKIIEDEIVCLKQLAIVEKYNAFLNYFYPVAQNMRRSHGTLRDKVLSAIFMQPELFIRAGKSNQIGRLYEADAGLAILRFYLRFLSDPKRKLISQKQARVAATHLAEVGKMLGGWIREKQGKR